MQARKLRYKTRHEPVDIDVCLEQLAQLRERYADFIRDNRSFEDDLEHLRKCLFEAEVALTKPALARCRDAFAAAMMSLEELAEQRQQMYDDAVPGISGMEAVQRSLKDFDMKRDFEVTLSPLL